MLEESKDKSWYYVRSSQPEPVGPVQADEIRFLFATNQITRRTFVWSAGMDEWKTLGEVTSLQQTDRVTKLSLGYLGIHSKPSARIKPSHS